MGFLDRLFGKKPPAPPPAPLDTSEASLRARYGDDHVKQAMGLAVEVVDGGTELPQSRDQVGGVPANIGAEAWPSCTSCGTLMTFVAQVACGPDEVLRHPDRGSIAIFLCGSRPPTTEQLCQTWDGNGTAVFFVGESAATPMFDDDQRRAIAAMQTASMLRSIDRTSPPVKPFLLPAVNGFRSQPVIEHAFRVERRLFLSCREPESHADSALYYAFLQASVRNDGDIAIAIDAFPQWIQGEDDEHTCTCGAHMELILQFDSFDDAINLGDAGRAYVFACEKRCGPRSFILRWACS
jgi:hypothetical protein